MYTRPMYNSEIILKLRVCAHVMCNAPCPAFIPKYLFRSRAKRERKLNARMCSHWNYLGPVSTLCTTNIDQRGRYFPPPPPRSHISPVPSLNGTILRNTRRWKAYDTGCGYSNLVRSTYKSRSERLPL